MANRSSFLNADTEEPGIPTPSNPNSGKYRVYLKTDGNVYTLNSAGNETRLLDVDDLTDLTITASGIATDTTGETVQTNLDSLNAEILNVVHKTGAESIAGVKTFTNETYHYAQSCYVATDITGDGTGSKTIDLTTSNFFFLEIRGNVDITFSTGRNGNYFLFVQNGTDPSKTLTFNDYIFWPNKNTTEAGRVFTFPAIRPYYMGFRITTNGLGRIFILPNTMTDIDAASIADGSVSNAEFQYINTLSSNAQTQLNGKQASLGFTPEDVANKSTSTSLGTSDILYPSQNAVKTYVDTQVIGVGSPTAADIPTNETGTSVQDKLDVLEAADITNCLRVLRLGFYGGDSVFTSTNLLPVNARVYRTKLSITSAFDAGTTVDVELVGGTGVSEILISDTESDPQTVGDLIVENDYLVEDSITSLNINLYLPTGSLDGSGVVTIYYAVPFSEEPISDLYSVEYLTVAGGAGGGTSNAGGGGGGGGYRTGTKTVKPGESYPVVIGAGGTGGLTDPGNNGNVSSFDTIESAGGGGGGGGSDAGAGEDVGLDGASGGGGSQEGGAGTSAGGSATPSGQGYGGGTGGTDWSTYASGGGGGGASEVGENHASTYGGDGGDGLDWNSLGTYYSGGGGGGHFHASEPKTPGTGGLGGGGDGGAHGTSVAENGDANTGGGGGGAGGGVGYQTGGNGGSGKTIIRYPGSQKGTGGTVTSAGGYTYHTFTGSGTFVG